TLKEVVGFDGKEGQSEPNSEARLEHEREFETKLILSSQIKGWNVSENLIGVKNIHEGVWEFGYALGASRPLALAASPDPCTWCRENFTAGVEMYGGLGEWGQLKLKGTSQYIAPVLAWNLPSGTTLRVSPGFGLTEQSHSMLVRFGVSHEISGFGYQVRRFFREIKDESGHGIHFALDVRSDCRNLGRERWNRQHACRPEAVCALLRGMPRGSRSRNGSSAGAAAVREELIARNAGVVYQERKATRGYAVLVTSAGSTTGADRRLSASVA